MHIDRSTLGFEAGGFQLPASFWVPPSIRGLVVALEPQTLEHLLAHDQHFLQQLCACGFAVLAVGLITRDEQACPEVATSRRFDIEGLAERTVKAIDWLAAHGMRGPVGLMAKGTAVAAALLAASRRQIGAIVSLCGRPDLAVPALARVQTPTLYVSGTDDMPSLHFGQLGADRMHCLREIQTIPGDGSLEAPTEAEAVASKAVPWFERHLVVDPVPARPARAQFAQEIAACVHTVQSQVSAASNPGEREISLRPGHVR